MSLYRVVKIRKQALVPVGDSNESNVQREGVHLAELANNGKTLKLFLKYWALFLSLSTRYEFWNSRSHLIMTLMIATEWKTPYSCLQYLISMMNYNTQYIHSLITNNKHNINRMIECNFKFGPSTCLAYLVDYCQLVLRNRVIIQTYNEFSHQIAIHVST